MSKKMKLQYRAVLSLILSAALFCMPVAAFSMNGNYTLGVRAEGTAETEENTETGETESTEPASEPDFGENETETETETVPGDEDLEPVCICEEKCSAYGYDHDCAVCSEDYKRCAYKKPNVTIGINKPDGWHNDSACVSFTVKDKAHTGNFEIVKIQAKVGQNGSWTDVTEDKKIEISENCTVYVQVTDQKDNTYERSRTIKCFDNVKPTLNASVSDGLLSVQVHDADSGARAVYVNGYEFTDLTNGTLNVRLQQFDAGYEYFTISAMDNAGNMSEFYKTKNPYYKDPADDSDDDPAKQLPVSAEATAPGNATAAVTEHTKTDTEGNAVSENSPAEQKKQAMKEADATEAAGQENDQSGQGKEFYTIQTASDKVFYLIIDRDGEEEMVYFLTEITENDLLNVTSDNSETLPKNSVAMESAIPVPAGALPNNNAVQDTEPEENTDAAEEESTEDMESGEDTAGQDIENTPVTYLLMGALAVAAIGGGYYFKVVRKKKEDFLDEDDEEDDSEYVNEDDDEENQDEDFFADDGSEADTAELAGDDSGSDGE